MVGCDSPHCSVQQLESEGTMCGYQQFPVWGSLSEGLFSSSNHILRRKLKSRAFPKKLKQVGTKPMETMEETLSTKRRRGKHSNLGITTCEESSRLTLLAPLGGRVASG